MMIPQTLAVVVALGTVAVPPVPFGPAAIEWQPCKGSENDTGVRCATLRLPIDWSDPGAGTFGFRIARRTADPATRIGTLVFGPGGPGDSGVKRIVTGQSRFSAELQRRFDIVSFDPRGVGGSGPVTCPVDPPPGPAVLRSQAEFDRTLADNRARWASCREVPGSLFDHADSASTVRDMDALRAALGERTLTFHGSSYGTLVGQLYAEQYPDRVRAIVLESSVDHSRPVGTFLSSQAWALQDSFDAFIAERGELYREHFAEVVERAVNGELKLTPYQVIVNTHKKLAEADYPGLVTFIDTMRRGEPWTTPALVPPAAVFCADWALPVRGYREYRKLLERAGTQAPDVRFPATVIALSTCLGWPQPVADPQHRLHVRTRTPLLVINSVHDPASGYNWATEVARQLGRHGVLLTYAGAGHGSYNRSTCTRDAVDAYLVSLTVPRRGTVCPAAP